MKDHHVPPSRATVIGMPTSHRFTPGDDVAAGLRDALADTQVVLRDGDVVCVASKIVALAEGSVVGTIHDDRRALARERAVRVVVETPDVLVTETPLGHVTAMGGLDGSNTAGLLVDLPADPDGSARRLRAALAEDPGVDVGVVVTDSAGRAWRVGQVEVALGAAGVAVLRDERGGTDLDGQPLGVTLAAVGDALAAASDLVRSKASGTPFVVVRGTGLVRGGEGDGARLRRPADEDLFRHGGPQAVTAGVRARRTVRRFTDRPVDDGWLAEAVAVMATAPAPHHTRPWRVVRLRDTTRTRLLDAMADTWRSDLAGDGIDDATIAERIARSDALLRPAPVLLAAFVDLAAAHAYPDDRRTAAERDLFVLSGGAALEAMLVALHAHGLGAAWVSASVFCPATTRAVLDLPSTWAALGLVAVGHPDPSTDPPARDLVDLSTHLLQR